MKSQSIEGQSGHSLEQTRDWERGVKEMARIQASSALSSSSDNSVLGINSLQSLLIHMIKSRTQVLYLGAPPKSNKHCNLEDFVEVGIINTLGSPETVGCNH